MGRWPVTVNGEEAFVAVSSPGRVELDIPSHRRIRPSIEDAEYIRQVIGLAIADAQANPREGVSDVDV